MRKLVFILLFVAPSAIGAQNKSINVDALYTEARALFEEGNYEKALINLNEALLNAPAYNDVRVLRIRIYQLQDELQRAEADLIYLFHKKDTSLNMEQLSIRQLDLISQEKQLLSFYNKINLFLNKSNNFQLTAAEKFVTFRNMEMSKQLVSQLIANKTLEGYQKYRLRQLIKKLHTNQVGVNHELISFLDNYAVKQPWNTSSAEYLHYFGASTIAARLSYSIRPNDTGVLYELESYHVFSKKGYAYANINMSNAVFYQDFGGSLSVFHTLTKGLEAEGGFRYLTFDNDAYFTTVFGLTNYVGSFYINGKAFIGPKKETTLIQSYQLNTRYYLTNEEDYVSLRIGTGISPDDRSRFSKVSTNPNLKAKYMSIGANKVYNKYVFQSTLGYLIEDIGNNLEGNQLVGSLGLKYRF